MKRLALAFAAMLAAQVGAARADSTINTSVPAINAPLQSTPIRNNFLAAATDITNLQGMFATNNCAGIVSPQVGQDCLNTGASPATWYKWTTGGWAEIGVLNLSSATFIPVGGGGGGSVLFTAGAGIVLSPNPLISTGTIGLASQIVAGGPTGDATHVAQITYNAQGQVTAVTSVAITPAFSSLTGTTGAVTNAMLANPSMTIAGHSVSLGGTQAIAYADLSSGAPTATSSTLGIVKPDNTTITISAGVLTAVGGGGGGVSTVSVVSANGFAGTVANPTTTPAITLSTSITGFLQGNGTAISAASTVGSGSTLVLSSAPTIATLTVTGAFTATGLVTNADLANSSMTIAGHSVSLGGTQAIAYADLSSGAPTATSSTLGIVKPDNTTITISAGVLTAVGGGGGGSGSVGAGTINNLAWYAATGTTVSGLATAANGVLTTDGSSVPSITATIQCANTPALTGDVTKASASCTTVLANIPTATTMAGSVVAANIAAPSTPSAGHVTLWTDSTDLRLHDKNSAGTIGTTVVADTGASNNFLTAISAAGVISKARPACANLSDSAASCSLDATNASNISTGTLGTGRLTGSYTGITGTGTLAVGVWQATVVGATYGGTGVNNGSSTITLGGSLTTSGAFGLTLTTTALTNVTLPTSGTLVNSTVATLSSLTSIGTIGTGVWQGTKVGLLYGGTNVDLSAAGGTSQVLFINASHVISAARPACADLSDAGAFCNGTSAASLTGTVASARIAGSYTGITGIGTATVGTWQATVIGLAYGGTNADLSATGGASRVLKQISTGAAITVAQLACADLSNAASSCSTDATNASNIASGNLSVSRLNSGTGAGLGTFWNGSSAWLSASGAVIDAKREYGVACDNVTNDDTAIINALAAATGSRTEVRFPSGICITTTTFTVPASASVVCAASDSTDFSTNQAIGNIFTLNGGTSWLNCGVTSSVTRTAGAYLDVTGGDVHITACYLNKAYQDIVVEASAGVVWITGCSLHDETNPATSAGSGGIVSKTPSDIYITDVLHAMSTAPSTYPTFCVDVQNGATIITNGDMLQCVNATLVNPTTGQVAFLRASNSFWDNTTGDSLSVIPGGTGTVGSVGVNNVWFGPIGANGATITQSGSANISVVSITSGLMGNYTNHTGACIVTSGSSVGPLTFANNQCGTSGASFINGFVVASNQNNFQISSNFTLGCSNVPWNTGGTSNVYTIQGNVDTCTNAGFDGGSGSKKSVTGNVH